MVVEDIGGRKTRLGVYPCGGHAALAEAEVSKLEKYWKPLHG
jgi:hypothetical protein